MLERMEEVLSRYRELEDQLGRQEVAADPKRVARLSRELAGLRDSVEAYQRYRAIEAQIRDSRELAEDADLEIAELARAELVLQEEELERVEKELIKLLRPSDPDDQRNIVLELRAGTGGAEASLFAADLFRMYSRYAEARGWKVGLLSVSEREAGGMKEVIAEISGKGAYGALKRESGVHRVQRVPATESQGRIHTSTVTVAVLPEAEEVDVQIDDKDLRVDIFRSSGPGGQSVNTTDSAVRLTHLPTGLVVTCQDEKSQHKNKARAMKVLRSRLYDLEQQRLAAERAQERRGQIGTGERSERIRTYNFPQNRVTDHRAGLTLHKLNTVLEGDLAELLDQVGTALDTAALR
ncbi:MAG: peptide chain release factor 1 [Myxococcota bacterium]